MRDIERIKTIWTNFNKSTYDLIIHTCKKNGAIKMDEVLKMQGKPYTSGNIRTLRKYREICEELYVYGKLNHLICYGNNGYFVDKESEMAKKLMKDGIKRISRAKLINKRLSEAGYPTTIEKELKKND